MLWAQFGTQCIEYDKSVFVWFEVLNFVSFDMSKSEEAS